MSRIGRMPIPIPDKVKVEFAGSIIKVEGPKGKLEVPTMRGIEGKIEDNRIVFSRETDEKEIRALHGLARALTFNAVHGVSEGFKKVLEIRGIGYRAEVKGKKVVWNLGYSHPIELDIPEGIQVSVEDNTKVSVEGIDKQLVGEIAAQYRKLRKPDPYKGKGVRYLDEHIKLKAGKAAVGTGA